MVATSRGKWKLCLLLAGVLGGVWPWVLAAPPVQSSSGPLQATIAVDTTVVHRTIPRQLYGTTVEWTDNGNGLVLPDGTFNSWLLQWTQVMAPGLIRFPGGLLSDFYHWKDGIGPFEERPTLPAWPGGPPYRHSMGTDEAREFARQVGSELLITVNIATGTPEEAADWVAYVNKGNSVGQPAPTHPVRYWELGNETYSTQGTGGPWVSMPPEEYAPRFLEFARAMRAMDPDIKIGAVGGENYDLYPIVDFPDWNEIVLTQAGSEIDFLAVHNAYAPMISTSPGAQLRTAYRALLAAPVGIGNNLQTLSDQIDQFVPERASEITIANTEWAAIFAFQTWHRFVLHGKTLGSALFAASVMNRFIENPKVEISTTFALTDESFFGWMGTYQGTFIPNSQFLALDMYANHFGSQLVDTATVSPTFDSEEIGLVAAHQNVPYLDVVSSLSQDGNTLFIMAVNKHFDEAIEAAIDVAGFVPATDGAVWTLGGTGIDANTGTDPPQGEWAVQAEDPENPRFSLGAPDEVTITGAAASFSGSSFNYTFPAHSVTSLELTRVP